ncbi:hypothetical protein M9H77_00406 [Catharanthus roseus]|nr:hypothetical protein M9H77_00406 [Catharanthus roseus]
MQGPFHSSVPLTFQFLEVHVLTPLLLMIIVIVYLPPIEVSLQQYRLRLNLLSFSEAIKHDKLPISMQHEIDPSAKSKLKFDGTMERLVILGNT